MLLLQTPALPLGFVFGKTLIKGRIARDLPKYDPLFLFFLVSKGEL